jgi:hypothetical protein
MNPKRQFLKDINLENSFLMNKKFSFTALIFKEINLKSFLMFDSIRYYFISAFGKFKYFSKVPAILSILFFSNFSKVIVAKFCSFDALLREKKKRFNSFRNSIQIPNLFPRKTYLLNNLESF